MLHFILTLNRFPFLDFALVGYALLQHILVFTLGIGFDLAILSVLAPISSPVASASWSLFGRTLVSI